MTRNCGPSFWVATCVRHAAAVAPDSCLILLIIALPFAGSGLIFRVASCTAALQPWGAEFPL